MSDKGTYGTMREFYTTGELADEANVTTGYIRRLLLSNRLKGTKAGRDWLIPVDEAKRWLASRDKYNRGRPVLRPPTDP